MRWTSLFFHRRDRQISIGGKGLIIVSFQFRACNVNWIGILPNRVSSIKFKYHLSLSSLSFIIRSCNFEYLIGLFLPEHTSINSSARFTLVDVFLSDKMLIDLSWFFRPSFTAYSQLGRIATFGVRFLIRPGFFNPLKLWPFRLQNQMLTPSHLQKLPLKLHSGH